MDPTWYTDSGATNHITVEMENMKITADYKGKEKIIVGSSKFLNITQTGYSVLTNSLPSLSLSLRNILRVPKIKKI